MKRVVRWIVAMLAAFVTLAATAPQTWAQAAPPATHISVGRDAAFFLDSLATEARATRVENAGCVTSYSVRDTLVTIERLSPAHYERADSVAIYAFAPLCPIGVPTLHSHMGVDFPTDRPSEVDFNTSKRLGMWALLLSVADNGWLVRIY